MNRRSRLPAKFKVRWIDVKGIVHTESFMNEDTAMARLEEVMINGALRASLIDTAFHTFN